MSLEAVPVVSLLQYTHYGAAGRQAFKKALVEGFRSCGFIRVKEHGVPQHLIDAAYAQSREFFALPDATKAAYVVGEGGQRGYTPFGKEKAKDAKVFDLKEFFHVGPQLTPELLRILGYGDNVVVAELPQFNRALAMLYVELQRVSLVILEAVAAFYDRDDSMQRSAFRGNGILRALHYPALPADRNPDAIRAAQHEDINLVTILPEATGPGLELLTKEGTWLPVHAQHGEFVVNVGDMLMRLTNGELPSTTHRVVNPKDSKDARYSMPFFAHPESSYVLEPWECCVPEGTEPMPTITAGDYLHERLVQLNLVRV